VRTRTSLIVLAAGAAVLALGAGSAGASSSAPALYHDVASSTSSNWGGYAVADSGANAMPTTFTTVTGSWVLPAVTCGTSNAYSSFWVGLGGFAGSSQALEQTGTEADCVRGQARYSVWYELVPAPAVTADLAVQPGDSITGTVTVSGTTVTMTLTNNTEGQSFTKTATVSSPDTSSAEWIAEAPASCGSSGNGCRALPLANFGTVSFTNASTTTAAGTTGTVGGDGWTATAITLDGSSGSSFPRSRFAGAQPSADAVPGALSADGSSFAVTYQQQAVSTVAPQPGRGRGHARGRGWGWGY
jgi:Peptidase A4 family